MQVLIGFDFISAIGFKKNVVSDKTQLIDASEAALEHLQ